MLQRAFASVVMMAAAVVSHATICSSENVITAPPVFQWDYHGATTEHEAYYSGTLEYGEVTLNIGDDVLHTRAYRQAGGDYSIPGPTMNMLPGNKYVLRFKNLLPYEDRSADHNVLKDPNVTNLHTHGLHISGQSPGDDVTRFFEGGYGGDFVYDIPDDHMGGTFWYHAHHHGSTFLQVSTGGFGLIVIDDSADGLPDEVAAMTEREMVIGFLDPDNAGAGGDTLVSGTLPPTWTVNGLVNGNLCVPDNEWQHWRVLLADADSRPMDVSVDGQCDMELMARDGVWRTTAPKAIAGNTINLTGASRADIAVRCTGDATINVGNTVVASVIVDGIGDTDVSPYDRSTELLTWSALRPPYLRDLRGGSGPVNSETVRMGARTINGSKFDIDVPTFELPADALQSWGLNGARNHPFHLHIYHVQMNGACGEFEDGEYYDVVADNCDLLFDLHADTSTVYAGRTIMHCHILEHEDQGAMGWLNVVPGAAANPIAAPMFPADSTADPPYSTYYAVSAPPQTPPIAPSNLAATAVSSSAIDLSWSDNSLNESEFEIERSPGGANEFANIAIPGANVTTYSDSGLSADTAYDYRVRASNAVGSSGYSNTASATTDPDTPGSTLTLVSLVVSTDGVGQGFKVGRADVVVEDDNGNPVEGALVDGHFTGTFNETISDAATDATGLVIITTDPDNAVKGRVDVNFCVSSITHGSLNPYIDPTCTAN